MGNWRGNTVINGDIGNGTQGVTPKGLLTKLKGLCWDTG
jgi:hypothetical protein